MRAAADDNGFERLYAAHYEDLLRYALRRVANPADAADVVAETWAVAWRRRDRMPGHDEQRLWLFGVARKVLANQRRGRLRQHRLADKLRGELAERRLEPDPGEHPVLIAMRTLAPADQDLLAMQAWEGLSSEEMAALLGCRPAAVRVRLHRARQRLRTALVAHGYPDRTPILAEETR